MESKLSKKGVCYEAVEGSPFQPNQRVEAAGATGTVQFLDYMDCGQTFPADPLVIVLLDEDQDYEHIQDGYWREELISIGETL